MTATALKEVTMTTGDEHHHGGDQEEHHHSDDGPRVALYTKPIQRQKWGDTQSLPHTNWGDHFFDLFYVAGAYNLGNLLRFEPSPRGLLYFAGCFWPLMIIWNTKIFYDGRFETRDDLWHRLTQIAKMVALGTAVLHIRTVSILSTPEDNRDMFVFCISISACFLIGLVRFGEIQCGVDGQPVAKVAARRDAAWKAVLLAFFVIAAVVAVASFASSEKDGSYEYNSSKNEYGNATDKYGDAKDGHRLLAGDNTSSSSSANENDIPVYICLTGSFIWTFGYAMHVTFFLPKDHKAVTVPINVSFTLHRNGDWIMLMLGESVLSLLIVESTNTPEYYMTFFGGILSITLMEYLHFRSQPHSANQHAMRRSKEAGLTFSQLMQIYSASLIILGASYKMLLYEFTYNESSSSSSSHRRTLFPFPNPNRWLLGGNESVLLDAVDRRQRTAHFFCGSLAATWLCLDLLILTHRGLSANTGRCRCKESGSLKWIGVLTALCRVGLLVFMATLSTYLTDPGKLVLVGLGGIIAQVLLRFATTVIFGPELGEEHNEHDEVKGEPDDLNKWPNVTVPQAIPQEEAD